MSCKLPTWSIRAGLLTCHNTGPSIKQTADTPEALSILQQHASTSMSAMIIVSQQVQTAAHLQGPAAAAGAAGAAGGLVES